MKASIKKLLVKLLAKVQEISSKAVTTDSQYTSNCNDATDPKVIYTTNGNTQNRPDPSAGYFFLRTLVKDGDFIFQIAWYMNAQNRTLFRRQKNGSGWSSWTSW